MTNGPALRSRPVGQARGTPLTYGLLLLACVFFLLPIVWIFSTSFKPPAEIFAIPTTLLPRRPNLASYGGALAGGDFTRYLVNSLITATASTAAGLLLGIPAAFGFARFAYRFSGFLLAAAVLTRMFPPIALVMPYFLELKAVGLMDTRLGLIIAYLPIVLPLVIWVLEGFFRDFPKELIEAARMDGLGTVGILVRIVVPLSGPALSVATLFGFLAAWNEFVIALTVTRTPAAMTMPVGIASYVTQFQTYWGQMTATAAVYLVPVLAFTIITQRGIVSGLMSGANKG